MSNIPTVLVLPYPAQSHVNALMILSQKLIENGCKVIFVNSDFNHKRVVSSMVKQQHSLDESLIKLVSISDGLGPDDERNDLGKLLPAIQNSMPTVLEELIEDIHLNSDNRINFILADQAMGWALNIGNKLGIKGALFSSASAITFAVICNIPTLIDVGIIDSDGFLLTTKSVIQLFPNMPEIDIRGLFWLNVDETSTAKHIFKYLMHCSRAFNMTEWCLCNTTNELESVTFNFFPKLLPVGPLFRNDDINVGQFWEENQSCINWLNQQPHCSVTYVAFGSLVYFAQKQFDELAIGLDLSDRPFLWVVREDNKMVYPNEFKGNKGKIVGWSPQQKVLSHPAISCFVSHCGWNSTMEGLSNGIPFLCWPSFGDQLLNGIYICDEWKVGLGLTPDENGLISRWEIKKKLDQLLNHENIKSRSLELKEEVINNVTEGGSSSNNINKFVNYIKSIKS